MNYKISVVNRKDRFKKAAVNNCENIMTMIVSLLFEKQIYSMGKVNR